MRHTALSTVGAVVEDLQVGEADAATVSALKDLLATYGVLVLRDQDVDDEGFVAFLSSFGPLAFSTGETPVPGAPQLNVVTNVGRTTPPKSQFHVDSSYFAEPPAYTARRAVAIPTRGGQTLFTNQYRAYETLPEDLRRHLDGRVITHVVTGLDLTEQDETSAEHPVFRTHPISGLTALYLSTPQRCQAVSGMDDEQARETVARLLAHSTAEANVYRHVWRSGDVVMWDNLAVLHKADHSGVVGDRVMHRGMVASYGTAAAA